MASSMSTPINQLPANVSNDIIKQNSHQLEDQSITDVINEMEREVSFNNDGQQGQQPQMQQPQRPRMPQPPPQYYQQNPQQQQQPPPNIMHMQQNPNMMQQNVQHIFQQQYPVQNGFQMQGQPGMGQQFQQNKFNNQGNAGGNNLSDKYSEYISKENAQRAILAAFIAGIVFYPNELGFIYAKIPYLKNIDQYDRILRTIFLACAFYVLLIKLNI